MIFDKAQVLHVGRIWTMHPQSYAQPTELWHLSKAANKLNWKLGTCTLQWITVLSKFVIQADIL